MASYFLGPGGSDGNTGLTEGSAWETLNFARTQLLAGDTLYLMGGDYDQSLDGNIISGATDWADKITIRNYPGHEVWLRPSSLGNAAGGYWVVRFGGDTFEPVLSPAYLEIDGINLDSSLIHNSIVNFDTRNGSTPHHIRFQNLKAVSETLPHSFSGAGAIVIGASIIDGDKYAATFNEFLNVEVSGNGGGYGFYVVGDDNLFDRCDVHHVSSLGFHIYHNGGHPLRNVVRNTRIHDITTAAFFGVEDGRIGGILALGDDHLFYNNLIYRIRLASGTPIPYGAILFYSAGDNRRAYNNTIYDCDGYALRADVAATNSEFINNIAHACDVNAIEDNGSGTVDADNHFGDPDFEDAAAGDFDLQSGSPAEDTGQDLSAIFTTDFTGAARPAGAGWDKGALERGAVGSGVEADPPTAGGEGGHGEPGGGVGGGGGGSGAPSEGIIIGADAYSDEEMHCPASYYGGYKAPLLRSAGDAECSLSDPVSGEPVPSMFRFQLHDPPDEVEDYVGRLRAQLDSETDRYWSQPITYLITSRANRALLGRPYVPFVGFIVDAQPIFPRGWDITLGDIISRGVIQEGLEIPERKIADGFLPLLDFVSDQLEPKEAEPTLYGRHTRTTDEEPTPPAAWPVVPKYLGIQTINGTQYHVWLTAGHACYSQRALVDGVEIEEGSDWLIATQPAWVAEFGTPYVDYPSTTPGVDRRYTLIYGKFGEDEPDACAQGDKLLTALVEGVETNGDSSGTLITDFYQQYKHFAVNYLANRGSFSYMSGPWLASPTWNLSGDSVALVDEESFDRATAIGLERRPGVGLQGAWAIGLNGQASGVAQVIAQANISGFCRFGQTRPYQIGIVTPHPTQTDKDAAPHFSDSYEIAAGSFATQIEWTQQKTAIFFRGDYNAETGVWTTNGIVNDPVEIAKYERNAYLNRDYPFIPGLDQQTHIATLELRTIIHPPKLVRITDAVPPDDAIAVDPARLVYRNLGDPVTYTHFDAVSRTRSARLAYVVKKVVHGDARLVSVLAIDAERLIDFDAPEDEEVT